MCPPAVALAIAAAAVTATGQVLNGIGQSQQFRYQAQVDDQNTKLANDQARDSIDDTNLEAQRRYRQLADTQGKQQAAMAANGVDLNFGSPVDVQQDTAMIGGEDVGQIYKAGYQRTHGFDIDAWNTRSQAAANRAKASGALTQGIFSGLGTALGGASQAVKMSQDGTGSTQKSKGFG